ncbi:MAG: hypothetical protein KDD50_12960 [Bdellovibrionales bacterium]|nr:hypothetical protein [Bdellovibrionales bacterium]
MRYKLLLAITFGLIVSGCKDGGSLPGNGDNKKNDSGSLKAWQVRMLGQEGHGGDAIVCFSIPIEKAVYKVELPLQNECTGKGPCQPQGSSCQIGQPCPHSRGVIWKITDEGRRSIESAKPLEQYMAEKIASKKVFLDELNKLSLNDAYMEVLTPFTALPGAFEKIVDIHHSLGWLEEDGVADEYGLMDVADSGFVTNIDKTKCKELQAVVRRDNQLWYDSDIVKHFDNAGKVLIQLHEELYTWGKYQDEINVNVGFREAHSTSTKTRRLILKLLGDDVNTNFLNSTLKSHGFSILYWENGMSGSVKLGEFMDSSSCIAEREVLKSYFEYPGQDMQFDLLNFIFPRYIKAGNEMQIELRHNYPGVISRLVSFTESYSGPWQEFNRLASELFDELHLEESCRPSFNW